MSKTTTQNATPATQGADYTPGPWEISIVAAGHEGTTFVNSSVEPGNIAAALPIGSVSEREANARLIAAAPEMHQMLKCICATDSASNAYLSLIRKAKALLARRAL